MGQTEGNQQFVSVRILELSLGIIKFWILFVLKGKDGQGGQAASFLFLSGLLRSASSSQQAPKSSTPALTHLSPCFILFHLSSSLRFISGHAVPV
jgi:hypothetical protein